MDKETLSICEYMVVWGYWPEMIEAESNSIFFFSYSGKIIQYFLTEPTKDPD